jgi:hypothetical protein
MYQMSLQIGVNTCLQGDIERHADGWQELIAHLDKVGVFSSFLSNRLLGDSTFSDTGSLFQIVSEFRGNWSTR